MKKISLLASALLLAQIFLVIPFAQAEVTLSCTDSDSGFKNYYYIKGVAESVPSDGQAGLNIADTCLDTSTVQESSCNKNGTIFTTSYTCPNGCRDGACVEQSQASLSCTDSDSGFKNYYYLKGVAKSIPTDGRAGVDAADICLDAFTLQEGSCGENGTASAANYICPNGCRDGACTESGDTTATTVNTGNQTSLPPPAGYEDTVITAFDNYTNPFPDTDTSSLAGKAASELYRRAVIGGYPDGQFKGSKEVNRAEAAKFLLYARYGTVAETANNGKFRDVLDGQWYTKFIVDASKRGIINGYADGTFGPGNTVNTAEFLKMLTLTFGLQTNLAYSYTDVAATDWFAPYAGTAAKYNLFPNRTGTLLNPSKNLTREEVAVAIYQYLSQR